MNVSDFLERTSKLTGDAKVYISNHNIDVLQQYKNNFYEYKEKYLHNISVGVDSHWLYCDIIWSFNMTPEKYNAIGTSTLRDIRGYSFDTNKESDLISSTDDNASGFHRISDIVILKNADFGKDVIVLYL